MWNDLNVPAPTVHQQRAPTFYYARHFRRLPNFARLHNDFHFGPSGDLGFLRYSVLDEDSAGFVVTINTRSTDHETKGLRQPHNWQAVADAIPGLRDWVHPHVARPLSDIFSYAGRGSTLIERNPQDSVPGLITIGDALCQTNPTQGWGISLGLHTASLVTDALTNTPDRTTSTNELTHDLVQTTRPFFEAACNEDRERLRQGAGEDVDVTDPASALFCRSVLYRVAGRDNDLHRAAQRRIHLLDPPHLLTSNVDLIRRAHTMWADHPAPIATAGPSPSEIAHIIRITSQTLATPDPSTTQKRQDAS